MIDWPPYIDVKDDVDFARRVTDPKVEYYCIACGGQLVPPVDVIDMREGYICHNNVTCYLIMTDWAKERERRE